MARYKHIDTSPRFLAVDLQRQLLPGTFEHALNHCIDHELDLSSFDVCFKNDATGAAAYPPAMLLKVILFATHKASSAVGGSRTSAASTSTSKTSSPRQLCSQRFTNQAHRDYDQDGCHSWRVCRLRRTEQNSQQK